MKNTIDSRRGETIYAAFMDWKAFDTVDGDKSWDQLEKLKTSSKMLDMIKSMYCRARSCVRWRANFSKFFECSQGVKQGCPAV